MTSKPPSDSSGTIQRSLVTLACRQCAHAKTKCYYDSAVAEGSASCGRCTRLKKQCSPRLPAKRKALRSPPKRQSRVAQLERKVDILVHAIVPSPEGGASTEYQLPGHQSTTSNTGRDAVSGHEQSSPQGERTAPLSAPMSSSNPTFGPSIHTQELPRSPIGDHTSAPCDEAMAVQLLNLYRNEHIPYFPFVLVPHISASKFQKDRPFLFKTIAVAAGYQFGPCPKPFADFAKDIFRELSERVLIKGEKNLDLLQGLLVTIAWYHRHYNRTSRMTALMQLAIALLADMGLNRSSHPNDCRGVLFDDAKLVEGYNFSSGTNSWTTEQMRVAAGCFYLSSVLSNSFRRVDALRYSSNIERICGILLDLNEHDSDILLVHLVRLQSVVENIGQTLSYHDARARWNDKAPVNMHIQALEQALLNFREDISPKILQNEVFKLHQCLAYVSLYEVALYDPQWCNSSYRLDTSWACLRSLEEYFNLLISMPEQLFLKGPHTLWSQLLHAVSVCSRLSLHEYAGWDSSQVKSVLNFSTILTRLMSRFEDTRKFANRQGTEQNLGRFLDLALTKFKRIKSWFDIRSASSITVQSSDLDMGWGLDSMVNFTDFDDVVDPVWLENLALYSERSVISN